MTLAMLSRLTVHVPARARLYAASERIVAVFDEHGAQRDAVGEVAALRDAQAILGVIRVPVPLATIIRGHVLATTSVVLLQRLLKEDAVARGIERRRRRLLEHID